MCSWIAGFSLDAMKALRSSSGTVFHPQNKNFKLFPFTTNGAELKLETGAFLQTACRREGRPFEVDDVVEGVVGQINDGIDDGNKAEVYSTLTKIVECIKNKPERNLRVALCQDLTKELRKPARFLVSMAPDRESLKRIVDAAISSSEDEANLVEKMVCNAIESIQDLSSRKEEETKPYFQINTGLSDIYLQDLEFVLSESKLTNQYLKPMLSYYFFAFVIQECLTLTKKTNGSRDEVAELYFALDSEKTTQSRLCYTQGFKYAESAIDDMFVHAATLELINTCSTSTVQYDYISLEEEARESKAEEEYARDIRQIADNYKLLFDGEKTQEYLTEITAGDEVPTSLRGEIDYLFRCIRTVIYKTRDEPRKKYARTFRDFCLERNSLLKNRRRNGVMFNLSDEVLMMLTTLSIGSNREKASLTSLFSEFEKRGVYLDEVSKESVLKFFESRSMIDRKSDSGETQYVNRIL